MEAAKEIDVTETKKVNGWAAMAGVGRWAGGEGSGRKY